MGRDDEDSNEGNGRDNGGSGNDLIVDTKAMMMKSRAEDSGDDLEDGIVGATTTTPRTMDNSSDDDDDDDGSYIDDDSNSDSHSLSLDDHDDPHHSLPTPEELYVGHASSAYNARVRALARRSLQLAGGVSSDDDEEDGFGDIGVSDVENGEAIRHHYFFHPIVIIFGISLLLVLVISLTIGLTLSNRGPKTYVFDDTNPPLEVLTDEQRYERLQEYFIKQGVSQLSDFVNPLGANINTPQKLALDYLVYIDNLSKTWIIPSLLTLDEIPHYHNHHQRDYGYSFITRYVLVVLYYSTSGPTKWIHQLNFLNPNLEVCNWYLKSNTKQATEGVICKHNELNSGDITGLWFILNGLHGTIPKEIGSLLTLESIGFIGHSQLIGTIPNSLEQNTNLREFIITQNSISGTIPKFIIRGHIGNHIQALDLSSNMLTGVLPLNITSQNINLKYLNLANNYLEGTIDGIFVTFPNIQYLHLEKNEFRGPLYPPTSGLDTGNIETQEELTTQITKTNPFLVEFDVSSNLLTGIIPQDWYLLSHLEVWDIHDNDITSSIPSSGSNIPVATNTSSKLWYVNLNTNRLTGQIPTSLGVDIPNLQHFDVSHNKLIGPTTLLPQQLLDTNVKHTLKYLNVGHNHFESGPIPTFIYEFTSLRELSIAATNRGKDIIGVDESLTIARISPLVKILQNLRLLDVSDNGIIGTIPNEIADILTLEYIMLQRNYISGTVPNVIGTQLKNLKFLLIDRNDIVGDMNGICTSLGLESNTLPSTITRNAITIASDCQVEVLCDCCNPCCIDNNNDSCHDYTLMDTIDYNTNYKRAEFIFTGNPNDTFGNLIDP